MSFKNAQQSRLLIGPLAYSAFARGAETSQTVDMLDTSVLESLAKTSIPGPNTSTFSLEVILDTDTTAEGLWDRTKSWKASAALPLTFFPAGYTSGSEVQMMSALQSQFTTRTGQASTVDGSIMAQGTDEFSSGVSVEAPAAVTADTTGVARDLTAASSNGGVAHLHVTAFSGFTSNVVTIEHSVDGSTAWAVLVTFATVAGITSERVVVAAGTSVRRYLRVVDDVTITGSCTRAVSFARR